MYLEIAQLNNTVDVLTCFCIIRPSCWKVYRLEASFRGINVESLMRHPWTTHQIKYLNNEFVFKFIISLAIHLRLCIKPGIQERGTERGEWGECFIPGNVVKHSGKCCQTFRGMLPNIAGNVAKHCRECRQTFRGMYSNIPGNIVKHSGECRQKIQGMLLNIPGNLLKNSGECSRTFRECCQTFQGMSPNIPGNVAKHSGECRQTFRRM